MVNPFFYLSIFRTYTNCIRKKKRVRRLQRKRRKTRARRYPPTTLNSETMDSNCLASKPLYDVSRISIIRTIRIIPSLLDCIGLDGVEEVWECRAMNLFLESFGSEQFGWFILRVSNVSLSMSKNQLKISICCFQCRYLTPLLSQLAYLPLLVEF
jgi:hypothetical protein